MTFLQHNYELHAATLEEEWFKSAETSISSALAQGNISIAQNAAMEWSERLCMKLGLKKTGVWKLFKRALVAKWFGKPENRSFAPNWSTSDALKYAHGFRDRSVRFSLFPEDIACHATSVRLPHNERTDWPKIISEVDNSSTMEMFPEPSPEALCFRRYTTLFAEETYYEAGIGQAMYVFEVERGQHPIVLAIGSDGGFRYERIRPYKEDGAIEFSDIERILTELILRHDEQLSQACFSLCHTVGLDFVSIEGYFDSVDPDRFLVVDLDLPFDIAFMLQDD